jgi:hypothetical protein
MRDAIRASLILAMAESLEPLELGAAVRILARILEKKGPITRKTVRLVAGVDAQQWAAMEADVLQHFCVDDETINIDKASHPIEPMAQDAKPLRKGSTPPLFPRAQGTGPAPETLPAYLAKNPVGVSLKRAIYDTGIRVLMGTGLTEKIARQTISNWLKDYSEGAVAEAIADAQQRTDLSDPHSWILARLRAAAKGARLHPPATAQAPRVPRAPADPLNGMSRGTFNTVVQRNQALQSLRLGDLPKDETPKDTPT